ncbi:MAG: hypothetical protein RIN55_05645 [Tissierellaceae bacterium]|nr:hypothetical protein [Tissierellaceae bacterium]
MTKYSNDIIRTVLAEQEEKIVNEIQEKEDHLLELNKEYYKITLEKEFLQFSHDKSHREIEIPMKLFEDRDSLEKEIRRLKGKLSKYRDFKEQTDKQLED